MLKCVGYHGTALSNVENIKAKGYNVSHKKSWFGSGVYFFSSFAGITNGEKEAKHWMVFVNKENSWAIFRAQIETDKFIDLLQNEDDRIAYEEIRKELINRHLESGRDAGEFKDRMVFIEMEKVGVDVVRALVDPNKKSYLSYVVSRPQVQVCVKNLDAIKKNELIKLRH